MNGKGLDADFLRTLADAAEKTGYRVSAVHEERY